MGKVDVMKSRNCVHGAHTREVLPHRHLCNCKSLFFAAASMVVWVTAQFACMHACTLWPLRRTLAWKRRHLLVHGPVGVKLEIRSKTCSTQILSTKLSSLGGSPTDVNGNGYIRSTLMYTNPTLTRTFFWNVEHYSCRTWRTRKSQILRFRFFFWIFLAKFGFHDPYLVRRVPCRT